MLSKKTDRVQVYIRTKPTSHFADKLLELDSASQTVRVHLPPHPTRGHIDNQQLDFSFSVDGLLHNASQEEVWDKLLCQGLSKYDSRIYISVQFKYV